MPVWTPPDPETEDKSGRFHAPPPGGGGGGGGGGFTGSFGGGGSGFYSQPGGLGASSPVWRRLLQLARGGVPASYSSMTSDTVPAMLTPGEFVVNRQATQLPGVRPALESLNGYASGGEVMDYDRVSQLLAPVLHMAYGGWVPQTGGFNTGARAPGGASSSSGNMFDAMRTRKLPGRGPVGRPIDEPLTGPTTTSFADLNPDLGRMFELLKKYQQGGWFDPGGSPEMMRMVEERARGTAQAQGAQAQTNARLLGLDAGQSGSYQAEAALRGQTGVAKALSDARLAQLQNSQQFGQGLYNTLGGMSIQEYMAKLSEWLAENLKRVH